MAKNVEFLVQFAIFAWKIKFIHKLCNCEDHGGRNKDQFYGVKSIFSH